GRVARSPDVAHGKPRSQARGAAGGDRCARILPYARGPIMAATEVNPRDFMALRNGKAGSRRRSAGALLAVVQRVVAGASQTGVHAVAAVDDVVPAASDDAVVASARVDRVRAGAAQDQVVGARAVDRAGAGDDVDQRQRPAGG